MWLTPFSWALKLFNIKLNWSPAKKRKREKTSEYDEKNCREIEQRTHKNNRLLAEGTTKCMAKGNGLIHLSRSFSKVYAFFSFSSYFRSLFLSLPFSVWLLCKHCVCVHEFLGGFCFSQKIESLHSFGLCLFVTEPRARNTCNIKFSGCRMPMNILDRFRVIISTLRARSFVFFLEEDKVVVVACFFSTLYFGA